MLLLCPGLLSGGAVRFVLGIPLLYNPILALSMQQCVDLVLYQILAIMQDSIQSLLIREDRHAAVGFFSLTQVLKSDVFSFCKTFVFLENC